MTGVVAPVTECAWRAGHPEGPGLCQLGALRHLLTGSGTTTGTTINLEEKEGGGAGNGEREGRPRERVGKKKGGASEATSKLFSSK